MKRLLAVTVVSVLSAALAGCPVPGSLPPPGPVPGQGPVPPPGPDPVPPPTSGPVPVIAVQPHGLEFFAQPGDRDTRELTVANPGSGVLSYQITADNAWFSVSPDRGAVDAGGAVAIQVTFAPPAGMSGSRQSATLTIAHNDPARAAQLVELQATVPARAAPAIELSVGQLELGEVLPGRTATGEFVIRNRGEAPLRYNIQSNQRRFRVVPTRGRIASRGQGLIRVSFTPEPSVPAGPHSAILDISHNDSKRPPLSVTVNAAFAYPAAPDIELSASSLDMGAVVPGRLSTRELTVWNRGRAPLRYRLRSSRRAFRASPDRGRIPPGARVRIQITFSARPDAPAGARTASLELTHNDPANPPLRVDLRATVLVPSAPLIEIKPRQLEFGNVLPGSSARREVVIWNRGTAPLRYRIRSTGPRFRPLPDRGRIEPGSSHRIEVVFSPRPAARPGQRQATLDVTHNVGGQPPRRIGMRAAVVRPSAPSIEIDPGQVDFGSVLPGSSVRREVVIWNRGTAPLRYRIRSTGRRFRPLPDRGRIESGSSHRIEVVFSPRPGAALGVRQTALEVTHNDGSQGPGRVDMRARVVRPSAPGIEIKPRRVELGDVLPGSTTTGEVVIWNRGSAPLQYRIVSRKPRVLRAQPDRGRIQPGASQRIGITFAPRPRARSGPRDMSLEVTHNDTATPPVRIEVKATVASAPAPSLQIEPQRLDFGKVQPGRRATREFVVWNRGQAQLRYQIRPDKSMLRVSRTRGTIDPGHNHRILVTLAIRQGSPAGTVRASLQVAHNVPDQPPIQMPLSAAVIDSGPVADPSPPQVQMKVSVGGGTMTVRETDARRVLSPNDVLQFRAFARDRQSGIKTSYLTGKIKYRCAYGRQQSRVLEDDIRLESPAGTPSDGHQPGVSHTVRLADLVTKPCGSGFSVRGVSGHVRAGAVNNAGSTTRTGKYVFEYKTTRPR